MGLRDYCVRRGQVLTDLRKTAGEGSLLIVRSASPGTRNLAGEGREYSTELHLTGQNYFSRQSRGGVRARILKAAENNGVTQVHYPSEAPPSVQAEVESDLSSVLRAEVAFLTDNQSTPPSDYSNFHVEATLPFQGSAKITLDPIPVADQRKTELAKEIAGFEKTISGLSTDVPVWKNAYASAKSGLAKLEADQKAAQEAYDSAGGAPQSEVRQSFAEAHGTYARALADFNSANRAYGQENDRDWKTREAFESAERSLDGQGGQKGLTQRLEDVSRSLQSNRGLSVVADEFQDADSPVDSAIARFTTLTQRMESSHPDVPSSIAENVRSAAEKLTLFKAGFEKSYEALKQQMASLAPLKKTLDQADASLASAKNILSTYPDKITKGESDLAKGQSELKLAQETLNNVLYYRDNPPVITLQTREVLADAHAQPDRLFFTISSEHQDTLHFLGLRFFVNVRAYEVGHDGGEVLSRGHSIDEESSPTTMPFNLVRYDLQRVSGASSLGFPKGITTAWNTAHPERSPSAITGARPKGRTAPFWTSAAIGARRLRTSWSCSTAPRASRGSMPRRLLRIESTATTEATRGRAR